MGLRYTLRQLEYFVAAGEAGSIALGAERLSISPPAVSAAISHLEAEFGLQLFVRQHAQGVALTREGRRFLSGAREVLAAAQGLHEIADELTSAVRGSITIGCLVTLAALVLPAVRRSFELRHPEVETRIVIAHQGLLLDRLRRAEIDAALTYELDIAGDIAFEPLAELWPYAMMALGHPLAGRSSVRLDELAPDPFILLDLPLSREYFLSLFEAAGVKPTIRERVPDFEVLRSMVANGFGYSIGNMRPLGAQAPDGTPLARVAIAGPARPLALGIAMAGSSSRPRILEAFVQHCRTMIRSDQIPGMSPPL